MNDLANGAPQNPHSIAQSVAQPAIAAAAAPAPAPAPAPAQGIQLAPLKYALEIKEIAKCPSQPHFSSIGMAYRFAHSDVENEKNFLPIARVQPDRSLPGGKPVGECCEGWSLSMFTTLDALQDKAKKAIKSSPQFLKRVGECYTQLKITSSCGVHTDPSSSGHFEFFERATFDCRKAVINHGKMKL